MIVVSNRDKGFQVALALMGNPAYIQSLIAAKQVNGLGYIPAGVIAEQTQLITALVASRLDESDAAERNRGT